MIRIKDILSIIFYFEFQLSIEISVNFKFWRQRVYKKRFFQKENIDECLEHTNVDQREAILSKHWTDHKQAINNNYSERRKNVFMLCMAARKRHRWTCMVHKTYMILWLACEKNISNCESRMCWKTSRFRLSTHQINAKTSTTSAIPVQNQSTYSNTIP